MMPLVSAPALSLLSGIYPDIIGQTLVNGATVRTPWMVSQGDGVTICIEVLNRSTNATLTVSFQHKNSGTSDASATTDGTTISANTVGVHKQRYTSVKQLFRLVFAASGSANLDWSHVRMVPSAWEHNGNALPFAAGGLGVAIVPQGILGVTLFKGQTLYGSWALRDGNSATHLVQAISDGGADLVVTIQHKEPELSDDAGNISNLANTISISAVGVQSAHNTNFKGLWRYKWVVDGANAFSWLHVRALAPEWEGN